MSCSTTPPLSLWPSFEWVRQEASCLNDPQRLLFSSNDAEHVRDQVSSVMKSHKLQITLAKTELHARMYHVPLGALSLSRLDYGATAAINPEPFETFYLVTMPVRGSAQIQSDSHHILSSPELAAVLNPQDTIRMCWHPGNEQIILKLSRSLMEQALAGQLGRPLEQPLQFNIGFRWQDSTPWRSLLAYLLACATQYPDLSQHPLVHAQLEQMVASALLLMQRHNYSDLPPQTRSTVLPRHVRRAQEYLHNHAHEPITTTQLALIAGISTRSLNAGFREFLGVSPSQYLRELRLQRVRDDLLSGGGPNIASIALRWGFEHMGRFAAQYRQAFGETPSQTLRRS